MLTERTVWLGATTVVICILLVMTLQSRLERRDPERPDDIVLYATYGNCGGAWRVTLR